MNLSKEHKGNNQFIVSLDIQNVYFKNHGILEYVKDQYILKNATNYKTFEENELFMNLAR